MTSDQWIPIVGGIVGGFLAAASTAVGLAWKLRGTLAMKTDIDALRDEVDEHDEKDDDRWEKRTQQDFWIAVTLGRIGAEMQLELPAPPPLPIQTKRTPRKRR